jgi:hypothetical protein
MRRRRAFVFLRVLIPLIGLVCLLYITYSSIGSAYSYPFNFLLPLHFRAVIISVSGVWLWGANLHMLQRCHIRPEVLFKTTSEAVSPRSLYKLALCLTSVLSVILSGYWTGLGVGMRMVWVPKVAFVLMIMIIFFPLPVIQWHQRRAFHS